MSVLVKTTQAIDSLARAGRPMRLAEVADDLGLPKSSVHRLLTELTELRIARRTPEGLFALGPRLLSWGASAADSFVIRGVAEPWMHRLRDSTGESVHLYIRHGSHRVCLASVEGRAALRPVVPTGGLQPLGIGSSGKLLLAFSPSTVLEEVRAEARKSRSSIPDDEELARIRETHWSVSIDEREKGLSGAATSIRGGDGEVVAALSISGSSTRLTLQRYSEVKDDVFTIANEIGAAVGGRAERPV
ncbi:IclR family transcriptional regulator [Terrabacter sp. 2RAF25]|uniref:IclR family transcriptional regulator n=1 Tax=Terrabacter sp. 2RAF25 TaxID=3232998 RepID=UPI003F9C219E